MPRISQLNSTQFPSLLFEFPASKDGETVKLSIQQVRDLMEFLASEIPFSETMSVEQAISELLSKKAETDYVDQQDNDLRLAIAAVPRPNTANVGAAVAAAAIETSIVDVDNVAGVKSGTSNMRRWTWGTVKAWIKGWITKTDIGLSNVANKSEAQMASSGALADLINARVFLGGFAGVLSNTVKIGWGSASETARLKLAIDNTLFGGDWPINIKGVAEDSKKLGGKGLSEVWAALGGAKFRPSEELFYVIYPNKTCSISMTAVVTTNSSGGFVITLPITLATSPIGVLFGSGDRNANGSLIFHSIRENHSTSKVEGRVTESWTGNNWTNKQMRVDVQLIGLLP